MKYLTGGGVIPRSQRQNPVFDRDPYMSSRGELNFEQICDCLCSDNRAKQDLAAESTFFELRENCERFVDALGDNTFPDASLSHMGGLFYRWQVLRSIIAARYGFKEGNPLADELFTPRVFQLWHAFSNTYVSVGSRQQLLRMFDAGRADIDFLRLHFPESMQTRSDQFDVYTQYLARDAAKLKSYTKSLSRLYDNIIKDPNRLITSKGLAPLTAYARLLVAAESLRQVLTLHKWLPKVVNADEYANVKDLQGEILLSIYQSLLPKTRTAEILNELTKGA